MLMLLFHLGSDRYALESNAVAEVVPLVELKRLPHAPDYVAGLLNYRGRIVPVIDLCRLTLGSPCRARMSTRIMLVNYRGAESNQILGLMAERVTETLHKEQVERVPAGIRLEQAPYLGDVITDKQGIIQCVQIDHLLPDSVRSALFRAGVEEG